MTSLPPDMPLVPDAGSGADDPGSSRAELLRAIEQISDQLVAPADGDFSSEVRAPVHDEAINRLVIRLNLALNAAEQATGEADRSRKKLKSEKEEVERFAYIASHDLQEPLRIVASFLDLLERRYHDQLDETGREFIGYAVEGARRMQLLIRDLLAYSRIGRTAAPLSPVDLNEVVENAIQELRLAVFQTRAEISYDGLPEVRGSRSEMVQLFERLLSNGIKFRGEGAPRIRISAAPEGAMWHVQVRDNGMGIEPDNCERVFGIFQRLHSQDDIDGTGIGLAICKKIVENHGGEIWIAPGEGDGAVVHLTLPAASDGDSAVQSIEPPTWSAPTLSETG